MVTWTQILILGLRLLIAISQYISRSEDRAQGALTQEEKDIATLMQELAEVNNLRLRISTLDDEELAKLGKEQGWLRDA